MLKNSHTVRKRVGDIVPGVVIYLLHGLGGLGGLGGVGEIKYGLIVAARGAFTSWRPISPHRKNCKGTRHLWLSWYLYLYLYLPYRYLWFNSIERRQFVFLLVGRIVPSNNIYSILYEIKQHKRVYALVLKLPVVGTSGMLDDLIMTHVWKPCALGPLRPPSWFDSQPASRFFPPSDPFLWRHLEYWYPYVSVITSILFYIFPLLTSRISGRSPTFAENFYINS